MFKFDRSILQSTAAKGFAVAVIVIGGFLLWYQIQPEELPKGIAKANGRTEAVEVDIAAKTGGRIKKILVAEGGFIKAGDILAEMDTTQLLAKKKAAVAQLRRAEIGVETSKNLIIQREAETRAAEAVVLMRKVQLDAAERKLKRTEKLADKEAASLQALDNDRASREGANAALEASKAQLAASRAAIGTAKAQVIDAEAVVQVAKASIEQLDAELSDSQLKSPIDGRIQYRIAQPGEVVSPGGRVLNLVDLGAVYMNFFLPTKQAGQVKIGAPVRLVLDAAPQYVIPAKVSFVANVAQFTPKTVETQEEREKLMFRIKAKVSRKLLVQFIKQVKTGLPGIAYVRLSPDASWPDELQSKTFLEETNLPPELRSSIDGASQ